MPGSMNLNIDNVVRALMTIGLIILFIGIFISIFDLYVAGIIPFNFLIILTGLLLMLCSMGIAKVLEAV